MKRRDFLFRAGTWTVLAYCPTVIAQQDQPTTLPFREVKPIPEDRKRVIAFFDFSCPVSRTLHPTLVRWASTVPESITVEFVPACLPEAGYVAAARAWYAAVHASPERAHTFAGIVYGLIHDRGMKMGDPSTWSAAYQQAGIAEFPSAWRRVRPDALDRSVRLLNSYGVTATPSLCIGGRLVITPDNTHGDIPLFIQLANGLVSQIL